MARPPSVDAFDELIRAQREVHGHIEVAHDEEGNVVLFSPACTVAIKNNKDQLMVDVFGLFQHKGLGWLNKNLADQFGVPFLTALGEVLWEITDNWDMLASKTCKPAPHYNLYHVFNIKSHISGHALFVMNMMPNGTTFCVCPPFHHVVRNKIRPCLRAVYYK